MDHYQDQLLTAIDNRLFDCWEQIHRLEYFASATLLGANGEIQAALYKYFPRLLAGLNVVALIGCGDHGRAYWCEDPIAKEQRIVKVTGRSDFAVLMSEYPLDEAVTELFEAHSAEVDVIDRLSTTEWRRDLAVSYRAAPTKLRSGSERGWLFIVMAAEGDETLAAHLRTLDFESPAPGHLLRQLQYAQALFHAVRELHSKDVIHADLKPDNIVVRSKKSEDRPGICLIDFGSARIRDSAKPHKNIGMQTPGYAAPRPPDALARVADFPDDIWSLGCIFYELIVGKRAFSGVTPDSESVEALIEQAMSALPPGLPPAAHALIRHMWRPDPTSRIRITEATQRIDEIVDSLVTPGPSEEQPATNGMARIALDRTIDDSRVEKPVRSARPWIIASAAVLLVSCIALFLRYQSPDTDPGRTNHLMPSDVETKSLSDVPATSVFGPVTSKVDKFLLSETRRGGLPWARESEGRARELFLDFLVKRHQFLPTIAESHIALIESTTIDDETRLWSVPSRIEPAELIPPPVCTPRRDPEGRVIGYDVVVRWIGSTPPGNDVLPRVKGRALSGFRSYLESQGSLTSEEIGKLVADLHFESSNSQNPTEWCYSVVLPR